MAKQLKPLTRHGHKVLSEEHEFLRSVERPKTLKGIQTAAAEGDRSENAEYIYGRKKLRELDKRLRYLDFLLTDVKVIDPEKLDKDLVHFGSTIKVMDEDGKEAIYQIVGEGEADLHEHGISYKSPMAKALNGKTVGDLVVVRRPAGEIELEILEIL